MKNPYQVIELTYELAKKKCSYSLPRITTLSILAGFYLAMGATFSILLAFGFDSAADGNPILPKLLMGLSFPLGLALIMLVGAELFTGNAATLVPSLMEGRVKFGGVLRNLSLVWIGNFIGGLIFVYLFVHLTGLVAADPWRTGLEKLAVSKCSYPFHIILLKAIAANWFVCLAVWMCYIGDTLIEKMVGMWLPVTAFVMLGYEHSIANMCFIPLAMFNGAPITVGDLFIKSLLPATIGNIIGGALFIGVIYGRLFGAKKG